MGIPPYIGIKGNKSADKETKDSINTPNALFYRNTY